MTKEKQTQNPKMVKIHIEECGENQKLHLEGSIIDWLTILAKASKSAPPLKKAIILTADFFKTEFIEQQND